MGERANAQLLQELAARRHNHRNLARQQLKHPQAPAPQRRLSFSQPGTPHAHVRLVAANRGVSPAEVLRSGGITDEERAHIEHAEQAGVDIEALLDSDTSDASLSGSDEELDCFDDGTPLVGSFVEQLTFLYRHYKRLDLLNLVHCQLSHCQRRGMAESAFVDKVRLKLLREAPRGWKPLDAAAVAAADEDHDADAEGRGPKGPPSS